MAKIDFPNDPQVNDELQVGDRTYIWDGVRWLVQGSFSETPRQRTISFPNNPEVNDVLVLNGKGFAWNGTRWDTENVLALPNLTATPSINIVETGFDNLTVTFTNNDAEQVELLYAVDVRPNVGPFILSPGQTSDPVFIDNLVAETRGTLFVSAIANNKNKSAIAFVSFETGCETEILDLNLAYTFTAKENATRANSISFTPDGEYMAVAYVGAASALQIYQRNGSIYEEIFTPTISGGGYSVDFSPDGEYLALISGTFPFFRILKRSEITGNYFVVTQASPAINIPNLATSTNTVKWSNSGQFIAVTESSASGGSLWTFDFNTETLQRVRTGLTTGSTTGRHIAFSPDDQFLVITHNQGGPGQPGVTVRTNPIDNYNQVLTWQDNTFAGIGVAMSENYLFVGSGRMYKRNGLTWQLLPNVDIQMSNDAYFTSDEKYLISQVGLGIKVFRIEENDVFTEFQDINIGGSPRNISAVQNESFIGVAHLNSPFVSLFNATRACV